MPTLAYAPADPEHSLSLRAAWLAYVGGHTQEQIAQRLHISRIKAQRLVASALQKGLVKFWIEGVPAECMALEERLMQRFALERCTVVPCTGAQHAPGSEIAPLAQAAARFLARVLEKGSVNTAGVGHGRTLAAMVSCLPHMELAHMRFVSLLGSLTRNSAANPWDVVSRLAQRTGGQCFFLPAPFIANTATDAGVLRQQSAVQQVFELFSTCQFCVVGIGTPDAESHVQRLHSLTEADRQRLIEAGAAGEVCGHFVDAAGNLVVDSMHERLIGMALDDLRKRHVLAVAGGRYKARAISAVLHSGVLSSLIVDEEAARLVLDSP